MDVVKEGGKSRDASKVESSLNFCLVICGDTESDTGRDPSDVTLERGYKLKTLLMWISA